MVANLIFDYLLKVLLLPLAGQFITFAWGTAEDPIWLVVIKRIYVLLPVLGLILAYWISVASFLTTPFRSEKQTFLTSIFVTWWDFGRAVLTYWGGTFKFLFFLVVSLLIFIKLFVIGIFILMQDIVLIPFRVLKNIASNFLSPGVPWIAISLTIFWCLFEAMIFTFVTTSLVIDTLSNMTGGQLTEKMIRVPLYLFMLFIILGSYAVLSTWSTVLKSRNIGAIIKIGAIELVALAVEVVFLYREFVDALVPWFASHSSGKFELGIVGTLSIASGVWFGIRSLSWFLFASSGTPTIMAIIQGTGIQKRDVGDNGIFGDSFGIIRGLLKHIKEEVEWAEKYGHILLDAFLCPPLQVIAGSINFCSLFISGQHIFLLPITNIYDLKEGKSLLEKITARLQGKGK